MVTFTRSPSGSMVSIVPTSMPTMQTPVPGNRTSVC